MLLVVTSCLTLTQASGSNTLATAISGSQARESGGEPDTYLSLPWLGTISGSMVHAQAWSSYPTEPSMVRVPGSLPVPSQLRRNAFALY